VISITGACQELCSAWTRTICHPYRKSVKKLDSDVPDAVAVPITFFLHHVLFANNICGTVQQTANLADRSHDMQRVWIMHDPPDLRVSGITYIFPFSQARPRRFISANLYSNRRQSKHASPKQASLVGRVECFGRRRDSDGDSHFDVTGKDCGAMSKKERHCGGDCPRGSGAGNFEGSGPSESVSVRDPDHRSFRFPRRGRLALQYISDDSCSPLYSAYNATDQRRYGA
jgi:hypothetical protein